MTIPFYKYHGAGNDFVMIDNRSLALPLFEPEIYQAWCNRRMGIGADGVILLNQHDDCDFSMLYINANGKEGSMCGNGGRCIIAFAKFLEIIEKDCVFWAYDGLHKGTIQEKPQDWQGMGLLEWVSLEMSDVGSISLDPTKPDFVLDTGSPHYVQFVEQVEQVDVFKEGVAIRYNDIYTEKGINVNFVEVCKQDELKIRTYERGVEAVTLACGTGATAAAVAYLKKEQKSKGAYKIKLQAEGGPLEVSLSKLEEDHYHDIWLTGPAVQVYKGNIVI